LLVKTGGIIMTFIKKIQDKPKMFFCLFSIILLTFSFYFNPFAKFLNHYDKNFDWWSDSIIYSDIIYNNIYHLDSLPLYFQKAFLLVD